jgi:O-antigen biosynthesis protein
MRQLSAAWRLIRALPLAMVSPFLVLAPMLVLAMSDLFRSRRGTLRPSTRAQADAASVVIPNWNGRDLLAKYLPYVVEALEGNPENEIIVVDNASSDGSAEYVSEQFPQVKVLKLDRNLGFGGGSNAGFAAAKNGVVVLLNSDMRVERDFLAPLLEGFTDETVFAVGCQIFFSDANRVREETGLTEGWWENGGLRVRHRLDSAVTSRYPCLYGGGGSCAIDREKFLELGGFDEVFAPFYLEDTDLGYMAWKRGWKVFYEPRSIVYHEHRGTIGKHFKREQIEAVLKKNFILFCWKNIHQWNLLWAHFFFVWAGSLVSLALGDSAQRANFGGLWRALGQLRTAVRARRRAQKLSKIDDREAFRRPLGGYYRDRFDAMPVSNPDPHVLFISPYPIVPPTHGGGVFMYQTTTLLAKLCPLHLIVLLDYEHQREPHAELEEQCASVEYLVRLNGRPREFGSMLPHAVREYASRDLEWLIHREIFLRKIDVVQLEYTALAQYRLNLQRVPCILFEHDVYFQSIGRALPGLRGWPKAKAAFEYLRALRYELTVLPRFDRVQVCSPDNGQFLMSFCPRLAGKIDDDLRAGIDTSRYQFQPSGREPHTILFIGSFRHTPNQEALNWFVRRVLPLILQKCPDARFLVAGSDPPPRYSLTGPTESIELLGFVDDIREPLSRYAVFVCPILSGSGMRVKLLEAFAAGIPVVSTTVGAEGLVSHDGNDVCLLADTPDDFAARVLELLADEERAAELAQRARKLVVSHKDMAVMAEKLRDNYVAAVQQKRRS